MMCCIVAAGPEPGDRCTIVYSFVMVLLSVTEARAQLPSLLDRVEKGEEIQITRHGRPVAVLVRPPEPIENRLSPRSAEIVRELRAHEAAARARRGQPIVPASDGLDADVWIAEIRSERDGRG